MEKDIFRSVSRRTLIAAGALFGLGGLAGSAAAAPPKKVKPSPADRDGDLAVHKIGDMQRTIGKIQDRLEECDGDVCGTVLEHSFDRADSTRRAKRAARDGEWAEATGALEKVRDIVEGDIELLEGVEDRGSIGDVLGLERALLNQTDTALGVMPGDNVS